MADHQKTANYNGARLEEKTRDIQGRETTTETSESLRNYPYLVIGEEAKKIAEAVPMGDREYYEAIMLRGSVSKLLIRAGGEVGIIYNKNPITGEEEFGYVIGGKALFGFDYNLEKIRPDKVLLSYDLDVDGYEDKGKPIKDFQGMIAKIEGRAALLGVGISGEIDTKNNDEVSGSVGLEDDGIKVMASFGYRYIYKLKNPSEFEKKVIRTLTKDPKKNAENINTIMLIKDIIDRAEKLRGK